MPNDIPDAGPDTIANNQGAEYQAALAELDAAPAEETPAATPATPAAPTDAAPATPPATPPGDAPPTPPEPPPNERRLASTLKREAEARKLIEQAKATRATIEEELRIAAEIRAARASGNRAAALRALGFKPGRDAAEEMLLEDEEFSKEAPAELRARVDLQRMQRRLDQMEAERQAERQAAQQAQQQALYQQQIAAEHARLKAQVVPTLPADYAGTKEIAQDPEFSSVVLETIRQNDLALQEREEEYSLADVAKPVEQRLRRMYDVLHKAYGPKQPTTTIPAEKPTPAPPQTLSNKQHQTSTRVDTPRSVDEEYQAALAELKESWK